MAPKDKSPIPKPEKRKGESQKSYNKRLDQWKALTAQFNAIKKGGSAAQNPYIGFGKDEPVPTRQVPRIGGQGRESFTGKGGAPISDVPRYKNGAQWDFAGRPATEFTDIQKALVNAGYADALRIGTWDKASADAMESLMGDANRNGTDFQTQLAAAEAGVEAGGKGEKGQTIQRPNLVRGAGTFDVPAMQENMNALSNTFNELLGEDPDAARQLTFQQDVTNRNVLPQAVAQGQQDAAKTAAFMQDQADINAQIAGQGALESGQNIEVGGQVADLPNKVVEQAPSAAALAEWIARTVYPEKYGATAINKRLGDMISSLASGQSGMQRPLAR